ncbi:hypothetical protein K438DRAFT_1841815 [Mycena galopus ATCC 62051]|nr:hypothetical protein K438DRAFT_1841815 [Mycena galopus ATCC 62051]
MGIYQSVEPEVLRLLARLPQLTDLELDFRYQHFGPTPTFSLKHLVSLRASPTVVDHLIFHSCVCPSIRSIELFWNSDDTGRVFLIPSITDRLALRDLSPHISLFIPVTSIEWVLHTILSERKCLRGVHSIHITGSRTLSEASLRTKIVKFIALFPTASHVSANTGGAADTFAVLNLMQTVRGTDLLKVVEVNGTKYELLDTSQVMVFHEI